MYLDPRCNAVRGDLADIRLAARVFAPHYVAPLVCVVSASATLFERADGGEALRTLQSGDGFEVLEIAGDHAWGRCMTAGMVGYVDRTALELPA